MPQYVIIIFLVLVECILYFIVPPPIGCSCRLSQSQTEGKMLSHVQRQGGEDVFPMTPEQWDAIHPNICLTQLAEMSIVKI